MILFGYINAIQFKEGINKIRYIKYEIFDTGGLQILKYI